MYIDGEFTLGESQEFIDSYNPFTAKVWTKVPRGTESDANSAVMAAKNAFHHPSWRGLSATDRGKLLYKLGDLIAENAKRIAEVEVRDNGKLFAEMHVQLQNIPSIYYYYAGLADKIEGRVTPINKPDVFHFTKHEPLGVVVAIVPWNSPLMITAWKLAPALAAGNTVVLKPSEYASASALEFIKLVEQAGFPPGVVNVVTGYGHEVGAALVAHPDVAKVTFTGGSETGAEVYQAAAKGIKRVSLELGGKSPNIVFADANIDNAIKGAISGIFAASGQTCIAGSRLLVERSIYDEFLQRLVDFAKTAKVGDPMQETTQVGPVTNTNQLEKILNYIEIAKNEGARCVLGGERATGSGLGEGWFVQPTIFADVNNQMRIAQEEVFGPVLSVIPFDDEKEAIQIANDIIFGLASGVWTQDYKRALRMIDAIEAGTVWVNTYRAFSFMAPFGGYKQSGIGRENGQEAIYDYLQTKSVWLCTAEEIPNPFVIR